MSKETVQLGPTVLEGQEMFAVAHIFASFNDTFIHITDCSGRETYVRVTGGMKVKKDCDEASPYAAMMAATDICNRCKELGITAIHIKCRATGGSATASRDDDHGDRPSCGWCRSGSGWCPRCGRS